MYKNRIYGSEEYNIRTLIKNTFNITDEPNTSELEPNFIPDIIMDFGRVKIGIIIKKDDKSTVIEQILKYKTQLCIICDIYIHTTKYINTSVYMLKHIDVYYRSISDINSINDIEYDTTEHSNTKYIIINNNDIFVKEHKILHNIILCNNVFDTIKSITSDHYGTILGDIIKQDKFHEYEPFDDNISDVNLNRNLYLNIKTREYNDSFKKISQRLNYIFKTTIPNDLSELNYALKIGLINNVILLLTRVNILKKSIVFTIDNNDSIVNEHIKHINNVANRVAEYLIKTVAVTEEDTIIERVKRILKYDCEFKPDTPIYCLFKDTEQLLDNNNYISTDNYLYAILYSTIDSEMEKLNAYINILSYKLLDTSTLTSIINILPKNVLYIIKDIFKRYTNYKSMVIKNKINFKDIAYMKIKLVELHMTLLQIENIHLKNVFTNSIKIKATKEVETKSKTNEEKLYLYHYLNSNDYDTISSLIDANNYDEVKAYYKKYFNNTIKYIILQPRGIFTTTNNKEFIMESVNNYSIYDNLLRILLQPIEMCGYNIKALLALHGWENTSMDDLLLSILLKSLMNKINKIPATNNLNLLTDFRYKDIMQSINVADVTDCKGQQIYELLSIDI